MFENHIKEAKILNAIVIDKENGKEIFYNKIANYISLVFKILVILSSLYLIVLYYERSIFYSIFFLFTTSLLVDDLIETISRIIIKNPIFILKDNYLYYLKTNKWYNVLEYDFVDEFVGKSNYLQTFCMYDKEGNNVFKEKNWHLKNEDNLKYLIGYVKLIKCKGRFRRRRKK
jgi:hypothetical protein